VEAKKMENKLFELAAKRRSIRRYTDEHINEAVLDEIMKVALTAPCSFGHRPVEFVIVRDKNKIITTSKTGGMHRP
jgi:nitroreductase